MLEKFNTEIAKNRARKALILLISLILILALFRLLHYHQNQRKIISEYKKIQSAQSQTRKALQVMMKVSTSEYEILQMLYNGETYRSIAKLRYV